LKGKIRTYDAEDFFTSLNSHDQDRTLYHLIEVRKESAREEAEESV
jgi:hypothetical protein